MSNIGNTKEEELNTSELIVERLRKYRFFLESEKQLQEDLYRSFNKKDKPIKEYRLDRRNIIDFYYQRDKIGIEVKIKGSKRQIYDQLVRYSNFDDIDCIILVTCKSMGLPEQINGKRCYYYNLSEAWM